MEVRTPSSCAHRERARGSRASQRSPPFGRRPWGASPPPPPACVGRAPCPACASCGEQRSTRPSLGARRVSALAQRGGGVGRGADARSDARRLGPPRPVARPAPAFRGHGGAACMPCAVPAGAIGDGSGAKPRRPRPRRPAPSIRPPAFTRPPPPAPRPPFPSPPTHPTRTRVHSHCLQTAATKQKRSPCFPLPPPLPPSPPVRPDVWPQEDRGRRRPRQARQRSAEAER